MNEQLTLEQLAIYLPHKLKCELLDYKRDYVGEQYGTIKGFYFYGGLPHFVFKYGCAGKSVFLFKPILRPLSDLTDAFIDEYYELFGGGFSTKTACINALRDSILCWSTNNLSYDVIILLAKHHFDIHGLIGKGLAIDINTL